MMSGAEIATSLSAGTVKLEKDYEFDAAISTDEREFYLKAYPNVENVRERRLHCTVCRVHLGTAPNQQQYIKMHPILRVSLCVKCFDFYNTGEFCKGEDGSELYCRWCGQGGEVYCCSSCPFVFCKSCIVKNLERQVVADIENNENWNCFRCSSKILWPLRAQHWALVQYVIEQKREIESQNYMEDEYKQRMSKDGCTCCRLAKSRASNISSSLESLGSESSLTNENKRKQKPSMKAAANSAKRFKESNDEVVCTPDLSTMLEPDCQLTTSMPPLVMQNTPPPLVLRNSSVQIRSVHGGVTSPYPISNSPVYHNVNGFRIDLNTASQRVVYRLPDGKLIQVKRTGMPGANVGQTRPGNVDSIPWSRPCEVRAINTMQTNTTLQQTFSRPVTISAQSHSTPISFAQKHDLKRHAFPETPLGQARSSLQDKVLSAQTILQHLNNKLITFTNSNAYVKASNYNELNELYKTLACMCSYNMGQMQGLQNEIFEDMRDLGFATDVTKLQNGEYSACAEINSKKKTEKFSHFDRDDDDDALTKMKNYYEHGTKNQYINQSKKDNKDIEDTTADFHACFDDDDTNNIDNDNYNDEEDDIENNDNDNDENFEPTDNSGYQSPVQTFADSRNRDYVNDEARRREERSHAYDRKLTRLIEQYPAIWCTMHPDYGNFEVTRKQWRAIAVQFKRSENIKLRWKNIRKRYVRIERRIEDGKRFTGYYDKATSFLSNRNYSMDQWKHVDCGPRDNDDIAHVRENVAAAERNSAQIAQKKQEETPLFSKKETKKTNNEQFSGRPIEVLAIDVKIINFVKRNAILWRRVNSGDPHNQLAVRNLWQQLWRSMSGITFDDMVYRWHYLYEMYKAFRLKKIKNTSKLTQLELKYSKYLAKLYFLYKIDEQVMRSECTMINDDLYELDAIPENLEFSNDEFTKERVQDAADDKHFVIELVRTIKCYPPLWKMLSIDYMDTGLRAKLWHKVAFQLSHFNRDLKSIKLRWLLIKYNYYRYCRDRYKQCTPETANLCAQLPLKELSFLNNDRFHR